MASLLASFLVKGGGTFASASVPVVVGAPSLHGTSFHPLKAHRTYDQATPQERNSHSTARDWVAVKELQ